MDKLVRVQVELEKSVEELVIFVLHFSSLVRNEVAIATLPTNQSLMLDWELHYSWSIQNCSFAFPRFQVKFKLLKSHVFLVKP